MATPKGQPLFKGALQVATSRIRALQDAELASLMHQLLRSQIYRAGASIERLVVGDQVKATDDGCDGFSPGAAGDNWLSSLDTCWQFKSGTAGQQAKLKGEVLKPFPRKTLEAGGRYVVVASDCDTPKGIEEREEILKSEAAANGIPAEHIKVYGSQQLVHWANETPAIAADLMGHPEGLLTVDRWALDEQHLAEWQDTEDRKALILAIRGAMQPPGIAALHVHIQGRPGVGKSRLVLEACRSAPWRDEVLYLRQAEDPRILPLIDTIGENSHSRAVLVVDEAQTKDLRHLNDAIGLTSGRVRLITIGHCASPDAARIPSLHVKPIDTTSLRRVISTWHPSMPDEHVHFAARFADGYVRLARLASNALARNPGISTLTLLDSEDVQYFLRAMLEEQSPGSLYVVAVLDHVGWEGDVSHEGELVAGALGMNWLTVRQDVERLHTKYGVAPTGGRYRYISPEPLACLLAKEAWSIYRTQMEALPQSLPSEPCRQAYFDRIQSIADSPLAQKYSREVLSRFFSEGQLHDVFAIARWSALAGAAPQMAANAARTALEKLSRDERSLISDRARRKLIWTLVALAMNRTSFQDATFSLALLAEAENESWANNATAEFAHRFTLVLSGTSVPYAERLSVIDEIWRLNRRELSVLAIQSLARVGDRHAMRMHMDPVTPGPAEPEWRPRDGADAVAAFRMGMERLTSMASAQRSDLGEAFVKSAEALASHLTDAIAGPFVVQFIRTVQSSYPECREPLRRIVASLIDLESEHGQAADVETLEAVHSQLVDASLEGRVQQHVGVRRYPDTSDDLVPLAAELLSNGAALETLWSWLTTGNAERAWAFGVALAESDTGEQILAKFGNSFHEAPNALVCFGYMSRLRDRKGAAWLDEWIDGYHAMYPAAANFVFDLSWRCAPTAVGLERMAALIRTGTIPVSLVGMVNFSPWPRETTREDLQELLDAMLVHDKYHQIVLEILRQRIDKAPAEAPLWREHSLAILTNVSVIRADSMRGYYWEKLARHYLDSDAGLLGRAIVAAQAEQGRDGSWFAEHSMVVNILRAAVERDPSSVWAALRLVLENDERAPMFLIGFPAGIIDGLPFGELAAWADVDPPKRASRVASMLTLDFSSDDTFAMRWLAKFVHEEDVSHAFSSAFSSGGWIGSAAEHWRSKAIVLEEMASRTSLPQARRWASAEAERLLEWAEHERIRAEEEDLEYR